jgi:hypothetical protein
MPFVLYDYQKNNKKAGFFRKIMALWRMLWVSFSCYPSNARQQPRLAGLSDKAPA